MRDLHCCVSVKRMDLMDQGPFSGLSLRNLPGAGPEQRVLCFIRAVIIQKAV